MAKVNRLLGLAAKALVAASLFASASALAQASEPGAATEAQRSAQEAYRHALELFDHGRHAEALGEFKRANELSPSFRILYNVGLCQVALADAAAAVEAFSSYLREGGERIAAARRAQVDAEIARLSKQLAWLKIEVEEHAADVTVDGASLGQGPFFRELRVNKGRHTVAVRSADGTLKTQSITLEANGQERLRFGAQRSGVAGKAPVVQSRAQSSSMAKPPMRQAAWIAWGVTGALGVSSAITGVVALRAHGDEREVQAKQGVKSEDLLAARDKVQNFALATDILLVGTALAAGVSVYLTFRNESPRESQTALLLAPGSVAFRHSF